MYYNENMVVDISHAACIGNDAFVNKREIRIGRLALARLPILD